MNTKKITEELIPAESRFLAWRRQELYSAWSQSEPAESDFIAAQTVTTDYVSNKIYKNGQLSMLLTEEGYIEKSGSTYTHHYYLKDHLGNHRVVMNASGTVKQATNYYPSGTTIAERQTDQGIQPYKFDGKELDRKDNLNFYDYEARAYDPTLMRFTSPDPMMEKYYGWSPFAYCLNNPVRYVDPDGRSTQVKLLEDGTYEVIGGDLNDDDLNIYVYTKDDNGNYTVQGESIGVTTSITSFYDSYANEGNGAWSIGSVLNPNDNNGNIFLQGLLDDNPTLVGYMWNATKGEKYDFKATDLTDEVKYKESKEWYRGMPVTNSEFVNDDTAPVYTSAKDIGNMAAGYIAATKGLTWKQARAGFDGLQKVQQGSFSVVEKASSQNAQRYGFARGQRRLMINRSAK
jgi:RHS repeat-associated protein